MPFIHIKVLKGILSKEKKDEMIKRVSETVVEIEVGSENKDNILPYTLCLLEEVDFDHWGIGGKAVTPELLQRTLKNKHKSIR